MRPGDIRKKCVRYENTVICVLGMVEMLFAVLLLVPTAFALYFGEDPTPFLYPIVPLFLIGLIQYLTCRISKTLLMTNGLILVGIVWVVMFAICSIPYLLSGINALDAVFESVSGVTTTGITVIGDVNSHTTSLLIWRSMSEWIGGITVVVIFLYFLPMIGFGRNLFQNELAGSGSSNFTQRTAKAGRSFIYIYMMLSAVNLVILLLLGVDPVESLCLMFTTISTGGLMMLNSGMAVYSDPVQWVTILFMFLGGTNFYLHYSALHLREKHVYRGNSEFRMMIIWFLAISVVLFLFMIHVMTADGTVLTSDTLYTTYKNALFTTVSLGTTTGYYVDDFTLWPSQCIILLMVVAAIGASSSSTSGGIKFSRIRMIYEYVRIGFRGIQHSNSVYSLKIDGKTVDDSFIRSTIVVFLSYVITMVVATVVFAIDGIDMVDAFGLSVSTISNGGMGFGNFGPTGDYNELGAGLKMFIIVLMWVGRLEIVTALILFTPGFWKTVWLDNRSRRRIKHARSRLQ